jgi:hypothetical protein
VEFPADLGDPGRKFYESIASVFDFSDEPGNERLLLEAARIVDRLDELDAVLRASGTMLGSRVHPAFVESRQQQLVLSRLVGQLDLPSADESTVTAGGAVSDAAREVTSARWRKHGTRIA